MKNTELCELMFGKCEFGKNCTNCHKTETVTAINKKVIGMTANEYQDLAKKTINKLNDLEMEHHALYGMAGEVGEIHSLYQKIYQGHTLDYEHIKKELGDLLWFIAEFCTANHWTLSEVMELNIDKLAKRYPNGFTTENSLNRKQGDI